MLRTTNDHVTGQSHSIKVEKLPNGQFRATETILGPEKIGPVIDSDPAAASRMVADKCFRYDQTGEAQK